MYDYRKMVNRILVILFILLFSSLSFADDEVTTIKKEEVIVENLVKDISQYLAINKYCFVVNEECGHIYDEHVNNIVEKIEKAGFPYEKYYIHMGLMKISNNKFFIRIRLIINSKVNEEIKYKTMWYIKQKNKNYI